MDPDLKSLVTNLGALGILALLVFRLPQIFQIINDGKKEIATIMKDIQNEAYTNYASNLNLIIKTSDDRVDKLERGMEEQNKLLVEQTIALKMLNQEKKRE